MAECTGDPSRKRHLIPAELGLLTSEDLFHHSFGCAAIGMALVSLDGRFLMVNATLCNLFGYSEEEMVGRHYSGFSFLDDLEIDLQLQKQTIKGQRQTFELEKRYVHRDGSLIWGILSVSLVRDAEGKPLYFVTQVQDITGRKQIEQKLEESRLRYQSLLTHNPDIICMLDDQGRLISVNPAAVKVTGYTEHELIGKTILTYIIEAYWQQLRDLFHQAKRGIHGHTEIKLIHKLGHPLILEVGIVPIIINDDVSGIYVIAKDITKRKLNEEMIEELHHKNQLILNAVSDGIFGIDEHQGTIFWNETAERLTGYTCEEMVGKNPYLVLTQSCETEASPNLMNHSPLYRSMMEGVYDYDSNEVFYKKNGDSFPVEYMTSPIYQHGRIIGVVLTFKDITERQKTEEMLRKSEKLSVIGQIAAGVAHEIRNPLTSLKGFIQLLQSGAVNKKEYYDVMMSEVSRIELIITEMLVLAKPQMVRYQPKNIADILSCVVTLFEIEAMMHRVRIVMVSNSDLLLVLCEENQLKQAFINLLKNAMESMQDGGQIDILLRAEGPEHVRIILKDTGCGIPEHVLARLGEPFFTTKESGAGLGIMITSKIIEDHNGHLFVESSVGEGTVITVTLPIHFMKEQ